MKKYSVFISDPMSVNAIYPTGKNGMRFISSEAKEYRGEWRKAPKKKPIEQVKADYLKNRPHLKDVWMRIADEDLYIEGRVGTAFRDAGVPCFPLRTKVVVEAVGVWPDQRARDLHNFEKPICDAMQDGQFVPNDAFVLWRGMDFRVEPGKFGIELTIYEKEVA